jgi:hypothetical protein
VLRSTDGTAGTSVQSFTSVSTTSYTDTGLSDGEKYWYTVRRSTPDATSDSSQGAGVTSLPAPTSATVSNIQPTSADLGWTNNHDYGTVTVQYKQSGDTTWTNFATGLSRSTQSEVLSGLLTDQDYDTRIVATTEHTSTNGQLSSFLTAIDKTATVTSYSASAATSTATVVGLSQSVSSEAFTSGSAAATQVSLLAPVTSHGSGSSAATRGNLVMSRTDTSHSATLGSAAIRVVALFESVSSEASTSGSAGARQIALVAPVTSYGSGSSESQRTVGLHRDNGSHAGPLSSFAYNERSSLELIDHNMTWDEETATYYTAWFQESQILGDEDELAIRGLVTDDAKTPAALIEVEYDETGNGSVDAVSDTISIGKDEEVYPVDGVPATPDGYYRLKIMEYGGYNSLYLIDTALVN